MSALSDTPHSPADAGHLPAAEAGQAISGVETRPHETTAHAEGGLPQFEFQYWGGQIVWLLIVFAILYVLMSRVFTPRMRRVLDERQLSITGAIEQARLVQTEALELARIAEAETAEARVRSQRVALDAREKVKAQAAERQGSEDAKVAEKVAEAEARIRKARDAAMSKVGAIAADTTGAIVEKLTGKAAAKGEIETALAARGAR